MEKCVHFGLCGGCSLLDWEYSRELKSKENKVKSLFQSYRHVEFRPIIPSQNPHFYRNKIQLPFGRRKIGSKTVLNLGLFNRDSTFIVDQTECKIQDPGLTEIVLAAKKWAKEERLQPYNERTRKGLLKYLVARKAYSTGEILVGIVTNEEEIPYAKNRSKSLHSHIASRIGKNGALGKLVGIVQNYNPAHSSMALGKDEYLLWGRAYIRESLGDFHFRAGLSTFLQVNPSQTPTLYNTILAEIPAGAKVIDAFSGIGTSTLWISRIAKEVIGIEENPFSFKASLEALKHNRINGVKFRRGRVQDVLPTLIGKGFDHLVVDPPRIGLGEDVCLTIGDSEITKLVYVSCDPESLARDAMILTRSFYLKSIQVIDMFPRTEHKETIAIFIRKD